LTKCARNSTASLLLSLLSWRILNNHNAEVWGG